MIDTCESDNSGDICVSAVKDIIYNYMNILLYIHGNI